MENVKAGMRGFSALSARKKAVVCAAFALLIALIVALCISINMRSNIQDEYAAARNTAGEALYSNLYILMQTFDMTGVPNTDVENAILPQMRDYFIASVTLNNLITQTYGPRYTVLTEADVSEMTSAFTAYEAAYRNNTSTDLAQSNMRACMERVKELLNTRYSQGVLRAGR
ncbi:MAG: hypothetical protein IJ769_13215 [Clostridia bacterium]|nr:hypothetical protein [Clostridia bacterium]